MSDINCARCGEPWDAYGVSHGDMESAEARKFRKGLGCPACGFGPRPKCLDCGGSGKDGNPYCPEKCYHAKLFCWSPQNDTYRFKAGHWYTGYLPNVREIPDSLANQERREVKSHMTADGMVVEFWIPCPACTEPCLYCDGTGFEKVSKEKLEERAFNAAVSETEASDEEPLGILARRGF